MWLRFIELNYLLLIKSKWIYLNIKFQQCIASMYAKEQKDTEKYHVKTVWAEFRIKKMEVFAKTFERKTYCRLIV